MKLSKTVGQLAPHQSRGSIERRKGLRTKVSFGLMYSAMSGEDVLIGDGTVLDLSENGLSIRGDISLQMGMELTLFLYLPDREDPLFILEGRVAWSTGTLFGVVLDELCVRDGDRLRSFLQAQSVGQA